MRILGVDPGLLRTGYGLVEVDGIAPGMKLLEAGVIRTSSGNPIAERLADIFNNLRDIVREYKPEVMVLEKLYSNYKHPVTALLMGHARGIACLICGLNRTQLVNYPSTRIKKAVTGNGRASKSQIQRTVKAVLALKTLPDPPDISDALAMAISYVYIEGIADGSGRRTEARSQRPEVRGQVVNVTELK